MEPLSLSLAVYGAVVATFVAAWNIYQQIATYREQLDVQVVRTNKVQGGVTIENDRLWYKVTNAGRQPIWLHSIGGRYKRGSPHRHFVVVTTQGLPVKLEPGEVFHDTSSDAKKLAVERVRYLCARGTRRTTSTRHRGRNCKDCSRTDRRARNRGTLVMGDALGVLGLIAFFGSLHRGLGDQWCGLALRWAQEVGGSSHDGDHRGRYY